MWGLHDINNRWFLHGPEVTRRNYQPEGGESYEQVSSRAKRSLVALLAQHGKELDEPPKEFSDEVVIESPNVLPEGIPHVVVVSHNGFLTEFYDSMYGWNTTHCMIANGYDNAEW
jgi:probable phosphoglycerate mutase